MDYRSDPYVATLPSKVFSQASEANVRTRLHELINHPWSPPNSKISTMFSKITLRVESPKLPYIEKFIRN